MKKILIAAVAFALAGCSSTPREPKIWGNVIPKPDDNYTAEARGASPENATARALESAQATCYRRGMRHIVTSNTAEYAGAFGTEAARDAANRRLYTALSWKKQEYMFQPVNQPDDYLAVANFRCQP